MVSQAEALWTKARPYLGIASAGANASARILLKRAVELDKQFAPGWGHLSYCSVRDAVYGWAEDRAAAIKTAVEYAEKAHSLKPDEYDNIWSLAIARFHDGQHAEAISLYDDARSKANDDFVLLAESTDVLVCAGRADEALMRIDQVVANLPDPPDWAFWNRAFALMGLKQYDEAIAAYRALPALNAASAAELAAMLVTTKPQEAKTEIEAIAAGLSEEDDAAFLRTMPMLRFTAAAADLQAVYEGGMSKAQALIER